MKTLRRFLARLFNFTAGFLPFLATRHSPLAAASDARLKEEIEHHIALQTEENVRAGMSPAEARRQAKLKFGSITGVTEEYRTERSLHLLEAFVQDTRYAFRMLHKSPGFAIVAVFTLALGIGANTAIFSFIDAWVIQPLPYPHPERLVVLQSHNIKKGWTSDSVTSTADFLDFQKETTSFWQTAAWSGWNFNLTGNGPPALVEGARVSWDFFDTLGVKAMLGRTFTPGEDRPGAPRVAVIGEGLWKGRFAADQRIIGRRMQIGGESYAIVGVMDAKFQFPLLGISNIWTPMAFTEQQRADRNSAWFFSFGRLKPGVTQAQAAAETSAIFTALAREYPKTDTDQTMILSSMIERIATEEGVPQVMICLAVVALILLIACANVANLMLSRATQRSREMAVRGALGATRMRLIGQLLTESLLLFFFGSLGGILCGALCISWIESQIPGHIRGYLVNYGHVSLNVTTLCFTLAIAFVCGVIFGLVPAFETSGLDLNRTLKEAPGRTSSAGAPRKIFVAGEIAMACVVLVCTMLLTRSFVNELRTDPGFNPAKLMTAQLALPEAKYSSDALARNFTDAALSRIRALPGVTSAGVASAIPFGGFGQTYDVEALGKPAPQPGETLGARWTAVSPSYFPTMRIRLLRGRSFTSADGAGTGNVAVIDETFARQFWPGEDPLGQKLAFGPNHVVCTIVGVVNDIKMYQLRGHPERQMYVPLAQFPSHTLGFVARTAGSPAASGDAIRDAIWSVDADQPVSSVEELQTLITIQHAGNSVLTKLMVSFGVLALFLCAIGIYGVMAHAVAQRTREIGIRAALGAQRRDLMGLVLGQGTKLMFAGVVVGIVAALGLAQFLRQFLFGVGPTDPATFVAVAFLLALVALAACYVPASRAMRIDPMAALRHE
ncbi:MAG TPA: ABC transporter permease [Candidatus Acidoferrales bacterium]|nr:ABC transporter permease [Candidatus Acidoferrales bacterium]